MRDQKRKLNGKGRDKSMFDKKYITSADCSESSHE
jgi:hypothetical protein